MNLGNKLLNRQLKTTILQLKYSSLLTLLSNFESSTCSQSTSTYHKKGLKCAECILTFEDMSQSGFGRNNQQAHGNAIKSLFDSIIEREYRTEELKQSLKLVNKKLPVSDATLDLSYIDLLESRVGGNGELGEIGNLTECSQMDLEGEGEEGYRREEERRYEQWRSEREERRDMEESGCRQESDNCCLHYQLHLQSEKKILNLESRLKLLTQQNTLLKQCLLRDYSNKENRNILNQINSLRHND